MAAFAAAANAEPDAAGHWAGLGIAARAAGELGRSAAALTRATRLAPDDADLWRELGATQVEIHFTTNDPAPLAAAVEAWQRSLALDPDQPELARRAQRYADALR